MAGASFTMDTRSLEKKFGYMLNRLRQSKKMLSTIGEALVTSTKLRFQTTKDPDGKQWKKSVRVKKVGGQTLSDTGDLKGSINYEATDTLVAVGSNNDVYAHAHQAGSKVGRNLSVQLPRRQFLGINDDDMEEVEEIIKEHIMGF